MSGSGRTWTNRHVRFQGRLRRNRTLDDDGPANDLRAPGLGNAAHPADRIRRRDIDDAHLHALGALPAIDRETAGDVHRLPAALEQRIAELLAGGAERDRIDGRAVARAQPNANMRLPDRLRIRDGVPGQRDHRLRVAGAERPGAVDGREELEIGRRRADAFTSAFKELDPIPQFKATAKLGEFLEAG